MNTPLPATAKRTFRTAQEGQRSLVLELVEGTEAGEANSQLIGSCHIENLPPGQPAGSPVEIELHLGESARASVFVESLATGRRSAPEIQRAGQFTADDCVRWRDWLVTGSMSGQFS